MPRVITKVMEGRAGLQERKQHCFEKQVCQECLPQKSFWEPLLSQAVPYSLLLLQGSHGQAQVLLQLLDLTL